MKLWYQEWRDHILEIKCEYKQAGQSLDGWCQRLQRSSATRCGVKYPGAYDPQTCKRYPTSKPIDTALDALDELVKHPAKWPLTQVHGDEFWKAPVGAGFIVFYKGCDGKGHVALCIRENRPGGPVFVMYDNMKLRRMTVGWEQRVIGAFKFK